MAAGIRSILAASVAIMAIAAPAQAQERHWSIAGGDLKVALDAYARQSGRQIIYRVDEVRGVHSPGASGNYNAEGALAAILSGTGFVAHSDSSGAIAIMKGGAAARESAAVTVAPTEDIIVTGSTIHGQQPVGSQLIVIDRAEIERSGHTTAAEIVRALPQNFGGGVSNDTGFLNAGAGLGDTASTSNANGGTAFNLRGVGSGSTLTLVNGRRLAPSGTAGAYTDVSTIPITAIERVEVLPDGASALYGSDAIGGVVNFVLRKDFEGAETRATFGTVTDGPMTELVIGQTLGKRWSGGGLLLTGEYYRQNPLPATDRRAFDLDFRRYGAPDRRTTECTPGTITVGGQNFALDASGHATAGTNLCSPADVQLYPRVRRANVLGLIDQQIGSIFKIEADGNFARTINARTLAPLGASVTVPSTNPFYVNPLGNGAPVTVSYDQNSITGPVLQHIATSTYGGGVSLIAKPAPGWTITASASYGAEKVEQNTGYVDPIELATRAASGTTADALDPFSNRTSQATIDYLRNSLVNLYDLKTDQWIYRLAADGSLFALPGGDVRVGLGIERRDLTLDSDGLADYVHNPIYSTPFGSHYSRTIDAAFGELVVPLFGAGNARPGLRGLELSGALRGEHYSDFGDVLVPKFGVNWSPFDGFKARASYSRSFRAPSPTDLAGAQYSYIYRLPDSQAAGGASNVMILNGGNDQLHQETANTFSGGFDWAPPELPGLRLSVSYYDIDYNGRILTPSFGFNVLQDNTFVGAITRNLTSAQQAALCASTTYGGSNLGAGTCTTFAATVLVDTRVRNVAKLKTNGVDVIGSYAFALGPGQAQLSSNVAYVLHYSYATPGSALDDYANTVGNVPRLKIRSSVGYVIGDLSTAIYMDYINPYRDTRTGSVRNVDGYASFDLNLGYRLGGDHGPLARTKLDLNVQNLFDRQAPFVDNVNFGYDLQNYDLRGRFIRVSLTKGW